MTAGFALGPLAAGVLAQWAPAPRVVPYLPHIALMTVVLLVLRRAPETVRRHTRWTLRGSLPGVPGARIRRVVAPMAPWVFAAPAIAFALLPSIVGADAARDGIALTATITCLCALSGVLVQPLGRRLDARGTSSATAGLLALTGGLVLAAVTAMPARSGCSRRARSCSAAPTVCASSPGSPRSSASPTTRPWPA